MRRYVIPNAEFCYVETGETILDRHLMSVTLTTLGAGRGNDQVRRIVLMSFIKTLTSRYVGRMKSYVELAIRKAQAIAERESVVHRYVGLEVSISRAFETVI